tara:strand:- start:391 stop:696 length:306 start_codon:yes stop_codon:yes gene_type:complete
MSLDKHYGHYLFDKNSGVVMLSNDLHRQQLRCLKAFEDLQYELNRLEELESKLLDYISDEWNSKEIEEAKSRCEKDNKESVQLTNKLHPIQLGLAYIDNLD